MAELKTNAMRMLDAHKIPYQIHTYTPGPDIDGVSVAQQLGQNVEQVYNCLLYTSYAWSLVHRAVFWVLSP